MPTAAETVRKVEEFARLPEGWHYGEGMPPSQTMRNRAVLLLQTAALNGVKRMNAFPGVDGEIQVTFYHRDLVLELDLELDGSITIAEDEGRKQVGFKEGATWRDALEKLEEFAQKLWSSSESSIQSITIPSATISQVGLWTYTATNPFLLSSGVVRFARAVGSAGILLLSTQINPAIPQSIGTFHGESFRRGVSSSNIEAPPATIATTTSTAGREKERERPS